MSLLNNNIGLVSIRYDKHDKTYHISKNLHIECLEYEVEVCFFNNKKEISISQIERYKCIIANFNLILQDVIKIFNQPLADAFDRLFQKTKTIG